MSRATAVAVARGARPRALRDRARGHHHRRPLVAGRRGARRDRVGRRRVAGRVRGRRRARRGHRRAGRRSVPPLAGHRARDVRRRRRAPAAARPLRGGRHRARALRARRPPVRRVRGARVGGGDGQDHDEARVRRRAAPHAAASVVPRRARPRRVHGRRRARPRLPVLREAREHGLVGRGVEGGRPRRAARVVRGRR